MLLTFSLFLIFPPFLVTSEFVCPSGPIKLNSTYTIAPDIVPAGNCTFTVTYDPESIFISTFALVGITVVAADTKGNESVTITDAFGTKLDGTTLPASISFPPPSFTISIIAKANSKMNFGVSIYETKFAPFKQMQLNGFRSVDTNSLGEYIQINQMQAKTYTFVYSLKNQDLLAVAAPEGPTSAVLMNAFVYDGFNSTDTKLVGTLYSIAQTGPILSKSNKFTVYCTLTINFDGIVMITDRTNTDHYSQYNVAWAEPTPAVYDTVEISAENGVAALSIWGNTDYSNTIYVDQIDLSTADTTVEAYAQLPLANTSTMFLMATYTKDNVIASLPQHFNSYARTFVVNKGKAKIRFTTSPTIAQITKPTDGRIGFIASPDFGRLSKNLNSTDFKLLGSSDFTFTLEIKYASLKAGMVLKNLDDYTQDVGIPMIPNNMGIPIDFDERNLNVIIYSTSPQADLGSFVYFSVQNSNQPPHGNSTTASPKPGNGGNSTESPVQSTTKGVFVMTVLTSLLLTLVNAFL